MNGRDGHGSPRVTREVLRAARRAVLSTTYALALGVVGASIVLGVFASGAFAWGSAQGPAAGPKSPPFTQCPAVGHNTSCEYLIDVTNPAAAATVKKDSTQIHLDGADDALIGVQNDSGAPLESIDVGVTGSGTGAFAFDGDGLCWEGVSPKPNECPRELGNPFNYYGPDTYFTKKSADAGTVFFPTPLQPGQYTYFSLEAAPKQSVVAGPVNDVVSGVLTDDENPEGAPAITAPSPVPVVDHATIKGESGTSPAGTVEYLLYSDPTCEGKAEVLGKSKKVTSGAAEPSEPSSAGLESGKTYYWVIKYSGDGVNKPNASACGAETMTFGATHALPAPSITTVLSGGGQRGPQITVPEGTPVTDTAIITAPQGQGVSGRVSFVAYASPTCTSRPISGLGEGGLTTGDGPTSNPVTLPAGTYYFQAFYSGSPTLRSAFTPCGTEVLTVLAKQTPPLAQKGGGGAPAPPAPGKQFSIHGVRVNERNGQIVLTVRFPVAGTAAANAIVQRGATLARVPRSAVAARKGCRRGFVRVRRRCVRDAPVRYGAATLLIPSPGLYTMVIKPSGRVLAALRKGRKLNVVVTITFQGVSGGKPAAQTRSVSVKLARIATKRSRR